MDASLLEADLYELVTIAIREDRASRSAELVQLPEMVECKSCIGHGKILEDEGPLRRDTWRKCLDCSGTGQVPAPVAPTSSERPTKLWLWKNFVDGRPEYWAFDNPYPTHGGGDPMTLGEPCGYAIFKESTVAPGRKDVPESEVIAAIKRVTPNSAKLPPIPTKLNDPSAYAMGWNACVDAMLGRSDSSTVTK